MLWPRMWQNCTHCRKWAIELILPCLTHIPLFRKKWIYWIQQLINKHDDHPSTTNLLSLPQGCITLYTLSAVIRPTFRLEPRQRITSASLAASAAPLQLRGCSSVPRSPKCTMVSLSSPQQWLHLRPVPCLCRDVRWVTSNKRTYSLTGEQDTHT